MPPWMATGPFQPGSARGCRDGGGSANAGPRPAFVPRDCSRSRPRVPLQRRRVSLRRGQAAVSRAPPCACAVTGAGQVLGRSNNTPEGRPGGNRWPGSHERPSHEDCHCSCWPAGLQACVLAAHFSFQELQPTRSAAQSDARGCREEEAPQARQAPAKEPAQPSTAPAAAPAGPAGAAAAVAVAAKDLFSNKVRWPGRRRTAQPFQWEAGRAAAKRRARRTLHANLLADVDSPSSLAASRMCL
eukprot:359153-Chlamydomonas_euryale.AAC.4